MNDSTQAPPESKPSSQAAPQLLPQHVEDLRRSGLTDETIAAAGLFSVEGREVSCLLGWKGGGEKLGACLAFPFRDLDGRPTACVRLKPDCPRQDKAGKPVKYESPKGSTNQPFFPPTTLRALRDPSAPLLITEGEKKALKASQEGFPCIGLVGVDGWSKRRPKDKNGKPKGERKLVDLLAAVAWTSRPVFIAYDSDAASNDNVCWAEYWLARPLSAQGADVKVVRLPEGALGADGKPAKVGLDDFLVGRGPEALRELLTQAVEPAPPEDRRPKVVLGIEEHRAVAQAAQALAEGDPTLYQRGGQLVRVVRPSRPPKPRPGVSFSASLRIDAVPQADLRIRLTRAAQCGKLVKAETGVNFCRCRPEKWLVEGLASAGVWDGVRHLEGVVEWPVLRPDGSILDQPGYDEATALLYQPAATYPPLPEKLTSDDAVRAMKALLEPLQDFPFARPEHRAACIASALTPLARHAFQGPAPLFLADANVPGAGKGLLLDLIAYIVSGRVFARAAYTSDNDEMGKTITALAHAGERLVLLDNLVGLVGGPNLDAALTAVEWQGRILGRSQQPRVPLLVTWYGTGNNVTLKGDTARRTCHIRLECSEERPEDREGFRIPDLLGWACQHRGRLLCAALTVLSAYCQAGRPCQKLKSWGSFEDWTSLVRGAVVWAGLPDPGEARMTAVTGADRDAAALAGLLAGWEELDPDRAGLTLARALCILQDPENANSYPTMRAVLVEVFDLQAGNLPSSGRLGIKLRSLAGRVCGGRYFANDPGHGSVARWFVRRVGPGAAPGGGDGGDGGDVSPGLNAPACAHARNGNPGKHPLHPLHPLHGAGEVPPVEVTFEEAPP